MGEEVRFYRRFAGRMRLLALLTAAIIAVVPPATYFALGLREQETAAGYMSLEVSRRLKDVVKSNPDLWKFSVVKFTQVFDQVESEQISRVRVYDEAGALLAETAFRPRAALARTGSSRIVYNDRVYGRVEVDKVADSLLGSTALLALGFSLLGLAVGFALFYYPAAFVRRAEAEINEAIEELNLEVRERIRREAEVTSSLREKEVLLMEVHHRVKNNLQIIVSLINMQLGADGADPGGTLGVIRNRVRAMALVHERLYESPTLSLVDMGGYLRALAEDFLGSDVIGSPAIDCVVEAEGLSLAVDAALPIGQIVCELVTNSLKHAFRGRASGRIEVALRREEDATLTLTVRDDGSGPAADAPRDGQAGIGFRLVRALAGQLLGELALESGPGGFSATVTGIEAIPG